MIQKVLKSVAICAIVLSSLGCVTTIPLSKSVVSEPTSADSVLFVVQNNLSVTIESSNSGNSGLLGALLMAGVDAVRQEEANRLAKPIMAELESFNFRAVMRETLTNQLVDVKSITFSDKHKVETIMSNSQQEISYRDSTADTVLFVAVRYELKNLDLLVTATAALYPKSDRLNALKPSKESIPPVDGASYIYRNTFGFARQSVTAQNIKTALEEGALNISKQIVADLNNTK